MQSIQIKNIEKVEMGKQGLQNFRINFLGILCRGEDYRGDLKCAYIGLWLEMTRKRC
jgi:hypothetical protein